jgi:hypothetical protein
LRLRGCLRNRGDHVTIIVAPDEEARGAGRRLDGDPHDEEETACRQTKSLDFCAGRRVVKAKSSHSLDCLQGSRPVEGAFSDPPNRHVASAREQGKNSGYLR